MNRPRPTPEPGDPEVLEKAKRRQFSAEYKQRILEEADRCTKPGELGALLRREGLYSSLLSIWRKQRDRGALNGLTVKKRGRKRKHRLQIEIDELRREKERLKKKLETAELVIDFQKKLSDMLGIPLDGMPSNERE